MQVHLGVPRSAQIIESYGEGVFRVAGQRYEHAIAVKPEQTQAWSGTAELTDQAFEEALAMLSDCEVVLLGTGSKSVFVSPARKAVLKSRGLVMDSMDTGAACRTYNVLLGDGRKVGALLLPYD